MLVRVENFMMCFFVLSVSLSAFFFFLMCFSLLLCKLLQCGSLSTSRYFWF